MNTDASLAADELTRVPFSTMRRRIARHMVASTTTSPHVGMAIEVDYAAVDAQRLALGPRWKAEHDFALTYLPFIAWATCRALERFPLLNASVDGDALVVSRPVHLGIAVDLDFEGLIVPVVRDADRRSVAELAVEIRRLADLARGRRLSPDDVQGATYTITNAGPYGTAFTIPIINQPQVAILSTDGVRKRAVVVSGPDGDEIVVRPTGMLLQSFDHRALDGAYSAAFLAELRDVLEGQDWADALGATGAVSC